MAEAYNEEVVALLQKELTTYRSKQITTVLTLLNEGNTVPFYCPLSERNDWKFR